MVEVLKQGRFEPMPVEDQVIEIYAGTQGFLDDLPVEKVRAFLVDLCSFVKAQHPDVPKAIRDEKVLSDSNEEILRADITAFHKSVAPDESVVPGVA